MHRLGPPLLAVYLTDPEDPSSRVEIGVEDMALMLNRRGNV